MKMFLASFGIVVVFIALIIGLSIISFRNTAVTFNKTITAQVTDMKAKYNEYFNKVKEAAQVPKEQLEQLKSIYSQLIEGRKNAGELFRAIAESNPTIDQSTYLEIQRIIIAGRSEIYNVQRVHIDTCREYNTFLTVFPNNLVNNLFNYKELTPTVPISGNVDFIFETGIDAPVDIFSKE